MNLEQRISSRRVYEGKVLNLRVDEVRMENGTIAIREVVEHRGAAAIVPVLERGNVLLVRQYRYPIEENLVEIPAGTLQDNENPEACAIRELEEETGYRPGKIMKLAACFVAPGYSTEKIHIYLAQDLTKTQTKLDEDEIIELERMPLPMTLDKIRTGEIRDAKSIVGLQAAAPLLGYAD
jgi:ADP-ribose pyrophosphatase